MDAPKHGKIELWDVENVIPYEKNAKRHDPANIEKIQGWILKHGWTQPIVVQKTTGLIIAGHGRRLAALALDLTKVPVIVMDVDDATARQMRLADNALVSTDYDLQTIQQEIFELKTLGFEIDNLGFSEKELAFLNEAILEFNEDAFIEDIGEAVEAQKNANVKQQAETDEKDSPLSKAFGFKRLTVAQGRRVRSFMSFIEAETGKEGADALLAHILGLGL